MADAGKAKADFSPPDAKLVHDPDSGGSASAQSAPSPNIQRAVTTPLYSDVSSAATSTKPSREGSPIRHFANPRVTLGTQSPSRSRRNSADRSPIRLPNAPNASMPSVPSAAAIQRALSAAGAMHPSGSSQHDDKIDMPRPQRAVKTTGIGTPKSSPLPRINSPPPPQAPSSGSSRTIANTSRKAEQSHPQPNIPTLTAPSVDHNIQEEAGLHRSGMRTPTRNTIAAGGPLETVEENSAPSTPSGEASRAPERPNPLEQTDRKDGNPMDEAFARHNSHASETKGDALSGKKKVEDELQEGWKPTTSSSGASSKVPAIHSRRSYTNLPSKLKSAAEGTTKNMTVETETVSSVPQVAVGGGASERKGPGRTETSGSLRMKASTETIRPKKDKKRALRKTTSIGTGTGGYHSRHSLRPISTKFPSPEFRARADSFTESTWVEDDPFSPMQLESPTDTQSSGRSSFSMQRPPRTPSRSWSFGLTTFRARVASSKADVFEAKVASAVGEADSSDTEETFVYESSPPELPSRKVHSRTPSTASTFSQVDPYGAKQRQDAQQQIVGKKRSMKFATNYNTIANDSESTARSSSHHQAGRGSTPHHHHIGRFGRGGHGSVHGSIHDKEPPPSQSPKTPRSTASAKLQQQFTTHYDRQRSPNIMRLGHSSRKAEESLSYDLEDEGADDERAPLVGSVRSGRNRRRPLPGSVRQVYASEDRHHRFCGRVTAFASLGSLLAVLIAAIVIILILCTKPLENVKVVDIRNVLASESEIMLDLSVTAINPNIIAITITDLDVNVFAKSRHIKPIIEPSAPKEKVISSSRPARRRRNDPRSVPQSLYLHTTGKDEGTDPMPYPDDPSNDAQTMLLGPIYSLDSPLIFEASPLHHRPSYSSGEVRLSRPGNRTEDGGSARWERVLQHEFELIVRGVVKYSLPISSKVRSASIGGRVIVHPNEDDVSEGSKGGSMKVTKPKKKLGADDGSNVVIEVPSLWDGGR